MTLSLTQFLWVHLSRLASGLRRSVRRGGIVHQKTYKRWGRPPPGLASHWTGSSGRTCPWWSKLKRSSWELHKLPPSRSPNRVTMRALSGLKLWIGYNLRTFLRVKLGSRKFDLCTRFDILKLCTHPISGVTKCNFILSFMFLALHCDFAFTEHENDMEVQISFMLCQTLWFDLIQCNMFNSTESFSRATHANFIKYLTV